MWILTKKGTENSEEYVATFNSTSLPKDYELVQYIPSITAIAELLDRGTSDFNGVEWLLVELSWVELNKKYADMRKIDAIKDAIWICQDGTEIEVRDMTEEHLRRALRWIINYNQEYQEDIYDTYYHKEGNLFWVK